jgi:hypothetical protein
MTLDGSSAGHAGPGGSNQGGAVGGILPVLRLTHARPPVTLPIEPREDRILIRLRHAAVAAAFLAACGGVTNSTAQRTSGGDAGALPRLDTGGAFSAGGQGGFSDHVATGGAGGAGGVRAQNGGRASSGGAGSPSGGASGSGGATGGSGGACPGDLRDCNGDPLDGCETDISMNEGNCGVCGNICPAAPNASEFCSSGRCGTKCIPDFGDCDGLSENGCEQDLLTDARNCGACGMDCGYDTCLNGGCTCRAVSIEMHEVAPGTCDYLVPPPADGGAWNFLYVNVLVTPAGGSPTVIPSQPNSAACDATTGGWYYDDPTTHARIALCGATCSSVSSTSGSKVEVIFGCRGD